MHVESINVALHAAMIGLLGMLSVGLYARRTYRELPWFFAYVTYHLGFSVGMMVMKHSGNYVAYFYSAWAGEFIGISLGFMVIHEIFNAVLEPYQGLHKLSKMLFRWAAAVLVAVAVAAGLMIEGHPMVTSFTVVQSVVRLVQVGLLMFLLMFARYFGLGWKTYAYGIALGMGFYVVIDVSAQSMAIAVGAIASKYAGLLRMGSYDCALGVWLVYLLAEKPGYVREPVPGHRQLEEWDQALLELLRA
jgi:hypothetical protein